MISDRRFEQFLTYVQRTELPAELESRVRTTRRGRPRQLRVDVLLAAMMATADAHGSLTMTRVHKVLVEELSVTIQRTYDITDTDGNPPTLRQVRYLWSRLVEPFVSTGPKAEELTEEERVDRESELASFTNRLLSAANHHVGAATSLAIDATAIESAARPKGRRAPEGQDENDPELRGRCADPDARWGYRTKTHDNKTNLMFGFQMIAFTGVGAKVGDSRPLITEHLTLLRGNEHGTTETIASLDWLQKNAHPVSEVLADRGFTYGRVEDWAQPLHNMGVAQVLDLHPLDHGSVPHPDGYILLDGTPHCPQTPEDLRVIERPQRFSIGRLRKNATAAEQRDHAEQVAALEEFNARIEARKTYRFEKHAKTSAGKQRYICPARAGKVACGGCPFSQQLEDVPEVAQPQPDQPLKACRQESITIDTKVGLKLRQAEYWGSKDWHQSYSRRNAVESVFGILKSANGGGIRRGWTHQMGLTKTHMLLAIAVAAQNLRQLVKWAKRTGDTRDPLTTMDTRARPWDETPTRDDAAPAPPVS